MLSARANNNCDGFGSGTDAENRTPVNLRSASFTTQSSLDRTVWPKSLYNFHT